MTTNRTDAVFSKGIGRSFLFCHFFFLGGLKEGLMLYFALCEIVWYFCCYFY